MLLTNLTTVDIIAGIIIGVILLLAILYIVIQKKKGVKCIGCPNSKNCKHGCCCGGNANHTPTEKSLKHCDKNSNTYN